MIMACSVNGHGMSCWHDTTVHVQGYLNTTEVQQLVLEIMRNANQSQISFFQVQAAAGLDTFHQPLLQP